MELLSMFSNVFVYFASDNFSSICREIDMDNEIEVSKAV
jgi:hypothetical protein